MKTLKIKSLLVLLLALAQFTYAQPPMEDPKYGPDKETREICLKNLSLYQELYNRKEYDKALDYWRIAYNTCPQSTKNLYIHGVKMWQIRINAEKDAELKAKYADTLMMVYDQRIQYFKQEGYVLGLKGIDMYKYQFGETENAYKTLEKSMKLQDYNTQPAVCMVFVISSIRLNQLKIHTIGKVLEDYMYAKELLNKSIEKDKQKISQTNSAKTKNRLQKSISNAEDALKIIDDKVIKGGIARCEDMVNMFTPQFEAHPDSLDLLKQITELLGDSCTESELYTQASANLFEQEPSAKAARNLAFMYYKKGSVEKSSEYYIKAIELEVDDSLKAQYYFELAQITESAIESRNYARQAIKHRSSFGKAYLHIARLYASNPCGDDKYDGKAVYWVIVDKCVQAKAANPNDAEVVSAANQMIAKYSSYFPSTNEVFMQGDKGKTVTIGCWIGESTTARGR